MVRLASCLAVGFGLLGVEASKKKCPGHFGSKTGVANLCETHFPDAKSEKIWFIKFYAPWCGHCNSMKPAWESLGKDFKDDPMVSIGAVDCDSDQNKGLCGKYGVKGFPTIKAIISGKPKDFQGAREAAPMKQWITSLKTNRGSKGGSAKCQKGVFKSTVRDSVLPLCAKHYPEPKSAKSSWLIALYNKKDEVDFKSEQLNRMALDFGNDPVDRNKQKKSVEKQAKRLQMLKEKYNLKAEEAGEGKRKAGKSTDALAKFGAVCCDCEKDTVDEKCKDVKKLPVYSVFNHVSKKSFDYEGDFDADKLVAFALEKLEFVGKPKKEAKKEEL